MNHTVEDIVRAFNRLIAKQELERISVSEIASEARIGRATFYRYFRDKYDVMNYNYKKLLNHNLRQRDCTNYRDLYHNLYKAGSTQLAAVRRAFNSTGVNSFENFIYTYSMDVVEEITRQNRAGEGFTPAERLQTDVFCRGISYMYKKWVFGEYDMTADEAADALYAIMPPTLRNYWYTETLKLP